MKLYCHIESTSRRSRRLQQGMTLVETIIAGALMTLVISFVLTSQMIGLREDQLLESKAGIDDRSRNAIGLMLSDIRSAKGFAIGNVISGNTFAGITNGVNMQGTAVQLYTAVTYTNQAIMLTNLTTLYYFDTNNIANSDIILWRLPAGSTTPTAVASNLINTFTFTCENWTGAVQTVRTYKGVVHTTLQFRQFQYPRTAVGTNGIYDYYRIECRATPHLPDGP